MNFSFPHCETTKLGSRRITVKNSDVSWPPLLAQSCIVIHSQTFIVRLQNVQTVKLQSSNTPPRSRRPWKLLNAACIENTAEKDSLTFTSTKSNDSFCSVAFLAGQSSFVLLASLSKNRTCW